MKCGGYLDNFRILSILTLTFNCVFPCALGHEKLRETPRCTYVLIKLPNFVFEDLIYFALYVRKSTRDPRLEIRHAVNPRRL